MEPNDKAINFLSQIKEKDNDNYSIHIPQTIAGMSEIKLACELLKNVTIVDIMKAMEEPNVMQILKEHTQGRIDGRRQFIIETTYRNNGLMVRLKLLSEEVRDQVEIEVTHTDNYLEQNKF